MSENTCDFCDGKGWYEIKQSRTVSFVGFPPWQELATETRGCRFCNATGKREKLNLNTVIKQNCLKSFQPTGRN